jgi:hypothetical protein
MGFRNPNTSATAVETGAAAPGVRVYASGNNPSSGVVEWHAGAATVRGTLTASDTGSGGYAFTLGGGARLGLNTEEIPGGGGYRSVFRATAEYVDLGPVAKLRQLVGSGSYPAGYGTISFGTADVDTYGGFSIPPGGTFSTRWTCPTGQGGTYAVEGRAAINSVTAGNSATCRLLRNGIAVDGTVGDILRPRDTDSQIPSTARQLLVLAPGDYIELQGFVLGQSWTTRVTSDGVASTLTVERIG